MEGADGEQGDGKRWRWMIVLRIVEFEIGRLRWRRSGPIVGGV